ncbi:MAG: hypothetical protein ACXVDD_18245, partial [Polyangia bacterium]
KVTLLDGCSASFARGPGGGFSSHLHAKVELEKIGHADLSADYSKTAGFSGHTTFEVEPFAIFDRTSGGLSFAHGQITTDEPGITLSLAPNFQTYMEANVNFKFANSRPDVTGSITKLKPELGKIADAFHGATVHYKDGDITAEAHFDLAPVIPGNVLKSGSMLDLKYANRAVTVDGTLKPQDLFGGTVHFDEESAIHVGWSSATKKVDINGHAHADINKLATVDLTVKANAGGGDPAGFDLDGHIDATGLAKYIKGVSFGSITGDIHAHVGGGTPGEFKVSVDADVTGIPAVGITDCQAHIHGEFEKGQGLSGFVQVQHIKIGNVIGDGRVDLKNNKFAGGSLHILADFPSIKIEGSGTIAPSELGELSTTADLTVTPGEGSALAKFVQSGSIHVDIKKFSLEEAKGTLNLVPPSFLPLHDPKVVITYKKGEGITAVLTTQFDAPFAKHGEQGNFAVGYSTAAGLFAHIDFPITIPGFKEATVRGDLNKDGITIGCDMVPRENEYIKKASVEIGYGSGGFRFVGKVTLAPDAEHEFEVGVQFQQGQGFSILGMDMKDKHEDNDQHDLAKWKKSVSIPLASVGVASIALKLGVGVAAGYRMPKVKLKDPKIEGGLEALDSGGLPPISFGGTVSMGAYLALSFSVEIAGEIDLIIATASAGIGAKITAMLNLELGADVDGRYEQGKGALLKIDPFVGASLDLIASLIATLYAEVCWFTIIDKEYTLASVNFAHIDLGQFRPFNPIQVQLGGPGGTHLVSGLSLRDDAIDNMQNGVKDGAQKTSDTEAN